MSGRVGVNPPKDLLSGRCSLEYNDDEDSPDNSPSTCSLGTSISCHGFLGKGGFTARTNIRASRPWLRAGFFLDGQGSGGVSIDYSKRLWRLPVDKASSLHLVNASGYEPSKLGSEKRGSRLASFSRFLPRYPSRERRRSSSGPRGDPLANGLGRITLKRRPISMLKT